MLEIGLWKLLKAKMMIFKKVEKILKDAGIEEAKAESKLIVLSLSKMSLEDILLSKPIRNEEEIIEAAKKRANLKAPIQHILGFCNFMNEKYIVNGDVLIPRDETEILVKKAYELIKDKDNLNILEIGIGSGCISCALAKLLDKKNFEILGVDISTSALNVAIENILNLDLEKKVLIRKSDIFSKIRDCEKFDLIISNPPYIPYKEVLDDEVINFEPKIALFAKEEGLEFYKKIINLAPKYLKKEGLIAFEVGINQAQKVKNLLKNDFEDIEIIKDLAKIERVVCAKKSS